MGELAAEGLAVEGGVESGAAGQARGEGCCGGYEGVEGRVVGGCGWLG